jgi:hypothetical protein
MKLTERNIRNSKLLTLLLTFAVLLSAFCFGCSGSKKPAANGCRFSMKERLNYDEKQEF